jgi:hypothetical protein
MRRLVRLAARAVRQNLDLFGVWWALVIAQPLVPADHWLGRADLAPWAMLALAIATFLRARPLSKGHHPSLTPRHSEWDWWLQRAGLVGAPGVLLAWFDVGRTLTLSSLGVAAGATTAVVVLLGLSQDQGRTAWNPPGVDGWQVWLRNLLAAIAMAVLAGLSEWGAAAATWERGFGPAVLLGTGFLGISLMLDRVQHVRQRRRAGRKDGGQYRDSLYRPAVAFLMPLLGLWGLVQIYRQPFGDPGFQQAYLVALHVLAWAAIIWSRPTPVAMHCLLHEVVPAGGTDPATKSEVAGFDQPPEGALRINPLHTKRTRGVHPWLVPVQGARIGDLDDPVRPLWNRSSPLQPSHVMGEASFEPDAELRRAQWETITVRVKGRRDVTTLTGEDVQARRLVVLRAWPPPGARGEGETTYLWESGVPAASIQVVDAVTESISLRDGDVIVLSIEGVARAFELEIGAPVFDLGELATFRPPQLEDYVGGG